MMKNPMKSFRHLTEEELILKAEGKFFRCDQPLKILYRVHKLAPRRIRAEFWSQDFILNLKEGDLHILSQDMSGIETEGCFYGAQYDDIKKTKTLSKVEVEEKKVEIESPKSENEQMPTPNLEERRNSIKLVGDTFSELLDTKQHCQIGRDQTKLWIKDLGSQFGTFLNGRKLKPNVCQELKNGDLISLGIAYDENVPMMLEIGKYWIFKVYEMRQDVPENLKEVFAKTLKNSLILSGIFSNGDYPDVKSHRFVCRAWNEAIKPEIRARSKIVIDVSIPENNSVIEWKENLKGKLQFLENSGFTKLVVFMDNKSEERTFENLGFLESSLNKTGPQIKSLEIWFNVDSPNSVALFNSISQLCKSATEFTILENFKPIEGLSIIPSVRRLIFAKGQENFEQILNFFPNTHEIEICSVAAFENFLTQCENLFGKFHTLKFSNKADFPPKWHYSLDTLLPLVDNLPRASILTNLEIFGFNVDVIFLYFIFLIFRNNLKSLRLNIRVKRENEFQLFYEMECLTKLKLGLESEGVINLKGNFGSKTFPNLREFDMSVKTANVENIVAKNFVGFVNEKVESFRFGYPIRKDKKEWGREAEDIFKQCFPNARQMFVSNVTKGE